MTIKTWQERVQQEQEKWTDHKFLDATQFMSAEITELRAALAQCQADAIRYQWLKKNLKLRPTGRSLLRRTSYNGRPEYYVGYPENATNISVEYIKGYEYEIFGLATLDEGMLAELDYVIDEAIKEN